MNRSHQIRRYHFSPRLSGLGDAASDTATTVDVNSAPVWITVGLIALAGTYVFGRGLKPRPPKRKRHREPIVVSKGIGSLAGLGLLAIGGLVGYGAGRLSA